MRAIASALLVIGLAACRPAAPPSELVCTNADGDTTYRRPSADGWDWHEGRWLNVETGDWFEPSRMERCEPRLIR